MANRAVKWAYRQELPRAEKVVLVALADMAGTDLSCYPGQKLLAEMTGYSSKTVMRAVAALSDRGLIEPERRAGKGGWRTSNRYVLQVPPNGHGDGKAKETSGPFGDEALEDTVSGQEDIQGTPRGHHVPTEENPQIEPPEEHHVPDRPVTLGTKFAAPLCEVLVAAMKANHVKRIPKTIPDAWLTEARLMVDKDGWSPHDAKSLLEWATSHQFWKGNILSMPKFREKADQLRLQRDRETGPPPAPAWEGMRVLGGPES